MAVFAALSLRRVSGSRRSTVVSLFAAIGNAVFTAGPEREMALLVFKTVLATVLSWQFAVHVLDSPTPYYAPLAALLVVDRTLVRSLWSSAQTLVAIIVGMSVAWVIGATAGVQWWSMALVVLVALLIARWRAFGSHGVQVPTMAILSLLTVGGANGTFTFLTIVEILVGGVIGVATNAILVAPLHVTQSPRSPAESMNCSLTSPEVSERIGMSRWRSTGVGRARRSFAPRPLSASRSPTGTKASSSILATGFVKSR